MSCSNFDLTIEGVLADPLIGAAMRADRVDPRRFETMLRATARTLDQGRGRTSLLAALADRGRSVTGGSCRAW